MLGPSPNVSASTGERSRSSSLMNESVPSIPVSHPPGFRARRGLNWGSIGLLYASYYLCRYNFPIANKRIGDEFGLSATQMGMIISAALVAYAVGQMVNGFFADRIGGRK